jgi:hypothetical protein
MGFLRAGIAAGMSPADCASKVFQGIREERFWIFTHEEFKPGYQARCSSVLANSNPVYEPVSI